MYHVTLLKYIIERILNKEVKDEYPKAAPVPRGHGCAIVQINKHYD